MAINVADNFSYKGSKPLDARIKYETVAAMAGAATADLYDGCMAYVTATKKYYSYDSTNTTDPTTGKWREYSSGGGGGTTVVANPEGTATDDLEKLQVGNDIYSIPQGGSGADTEIIADDFDPTESYAVGDYVVYEGVLYKCTTAHTGAWDASDFDATQVMEELPTPMPSADMSEVVNPLPGVMSRRFKYSTTEQVVGEWIDGKPVYQKTFATENSTKGSAVSINVSSLNIDICVAVRGTWIRHNADAGDLMYEFNEYEGNGYLSWIRYKKSITSIQYLIGLPDEYDSTTKQFITIQYTKTTD